MSKNIQNEEFGKVFTELSDFCENHRCARCPLFHNYCYYGLRCDNVKNAEKVLDKPAMEPYLHQPYLDVCLHFILLHIGEKEEQETCSFWNECLNTNREGYNNCEDCFFAHYDKDSSNDIPKDINEYRQRLINMLHIYEQEA